MGCAGGFLGDRAKKLREEVGKVRRGCVYPRVFTKIYVMGFWVGFT